MDYGEISLLIVSGSISGFLLVYLLFTVARKQIINEATEEATEIIKDAREQFNNEEQERKERIQEIELEAWSEVEEAHLDMEERCKELETKLSDKKILFDEKHKTLRSSLMLKENELRDISMKLKTKQDRLENTIQSKKDFEIKLKNELLKKTNLEEPQVVTELSTKLIEQAETDFKNEAEAFENETKEFAEHRAKRILALTIDRFEKEMSTERGISASYFPTEDVRKVFCDKLKENVEAIQKVSGCDIYIDAQPDPERWDNIQIIGYDPVRRELTRRIFDRIFRDIEKHRKKPTPDDIVRIGENIKTELLNQIKKDGDNICKELELQNVHPEIRQVMGSLRYRYSYTQNQYFHCAEVGWFAGLLAGELGNEVKTTRRAGMLHDLGKALDHELDGSHAVIGADFISARNEKEHVVYAVRAHHHDVPPTEDMDFIVIAADAISGGRPGARRSTVETYTQKVSGLQEISKRFNGVTDVFVLNGGRECRVMVNSKVVNDLEALKISQQIAKTIEDEMQYPGQIKVVVVRETVITESTAGRNKQER